MTRGPQVDSVPTTSTSTTPTAGISCVIPSIPASIFQSTSVDVPGLTCQLA